MNWTAEEEDNLIALVRQSKPWADIAAALPHRTEKACMGKYLTLRNRGEKVYNPERQRPTGFGSGSGRPKNRRASAKLWLRLDRAVKGAFVELGKRLGKRPGALLRLALERLESQTMTPLPKPKGAHSPCTITPTGARVPVCWGVPQAVLRAACKRTRSAQTQTAERAVIELLRAYGYTIESTP